MISERRSLGFTMVAAKNIRLGRAGQYLGYCQCEYDRNHSRDEFKKTHRDLMIDGLTNGYSVSSTQVVETGPDPMI